MINILNINRLFQKYIKYVKDYVYYRCTKKGAQKAYDRDVHGRNKSMTIIIESVHIKGF